MQFAATCQQFVSSDPISGLSSHCGAGSVTLVSRADVVPYKAATDLAKGRAWPDTEGVTGSNLVAPTTRP